MYMRKYLFILLMGLGLVGFSQDFNISALTKVSILTVGPGDELNSKFGHSALRVKDPTTNLDIVYNYGMFDFDTPNFYMKFTRGKLDYSLAKQRFAYFLRSYEIEQRWVKEQVLRLNPKEVQALLQFLENNHLPENRFYKYDFFFDNCTTRLPEVLKTVLGAKLTLDPADVGDETTYRDLIHQNLELNSWSNFGIDLALGSVIDKKGTPFLPINVYDQLTKSKINNEDIVYKDISLLQDHRPINNTNFVATPLFWLTVLLIVVALVTYFDFKKKKRSRWLDFSLFFITGAVGLLILFLWFATDHQATKTNFNALWAFAPNWIVAFFMLKKRLPDWSAIYCYITLGLLVVTAFLWMINIQVFSPLIVLILVALAIRYLFLARTAAVNGVRP